jgi:hypothetical protein
MTIRFAFIAFHTPDLAGDAAAFDLKLGLELDTITFE